MTLLLEEILGKLAVPAQNNPVSKPRKVWTSYTSGYVFGTVDIDFEYVNAADELDKFSIEEPLSTITSAESKWTYLH